MGGDYVALPDHIMDTSSPRSTPQFQLNADLARKFFVSLTALVVFGLLISSQSIFTSTRKGISRTAT
ncbi:hypothetical protein BDN72DRAFT_844670, partial [Pluteus cervinus]